MRARACMPKEDQSQHGGRSWEIIRDKTSEVSDLVVDKRYLSKHKQDDAGQIATKENGQPRRRITHHGVPESETAPRGASVFGV